MFLKWNCSPIVLALVFVCFPGNGNTWNNLKSSTKIFYKKSRQGKVILSTSLLTYTSARPLLECSNNKIECCNVLIIKHNMFTDLTVKGIFTFSKVSQNRLKCFSQFFFPDVDIMQKLNKITL